MATHDVTAAHEAEFFAGVRNAAEFFMGKADVQRALEILARRLEDLEIPYDPAVEARRGTHVRLLPLERLVELKLASGMSAPHRLRDLADVLELIRICDLPADFETRLDASVREKFRELRDAANAARDE
jgi:hypothetical protein